MDVNSSLVYYMISSIPEVALDADTGILSVAGIIDREEQAVIVLTVQASDGLHVGLTGVSITVTDVNDNVPSFSQDMYSMTVGTADIVGQQVAMVTANDLDLEENAELMYWLVGGQGMFEIGMDTGIVTLAYSVEQFTSTVYYMKVFAQDHGTPSLFSNVSLVARISTLNLYSPVFDQFVYEVRVSEGIVVGEQVLYLNVSDQDGGDAGELSLAITSPIPQYTFNINNQGALTLLTTLDFEVKSRYEIVVTATDHGDNPRSSHIAVIVSVSDVNDNPPQFLAAPTEVHVAGPVPANSLLTRVVATDADSDANGNNDIMYMLTSGSDWYYVDSSTGAVRSKSVVTDGVYSLTVVARDQGNPPLASVLDLAIRVLTAAESSLYPEFLQATYEATVEEAMAWPSVAVDIDATLNGGDPDQAIYYVITAGNTAALFSINADTVGECAMTDQRHH